MPAIELHIQGLRTLADVRLRLDGLTVLIGDNGSGKSSIIEACEILRRAAGERFMEELQTIHGGMTGLLRHGAKELRLGITLDDHIIYELALQSESGTGLISHERLLTRRLAAWQIVFQRDLDSGVLYSETGAETALSVRRNVLMMRMPLPAFGPPLLDPRSWLIDRLSKLQIHLPFEVVPSWAARAHDRKSALRNSTLIAQADRLDTFGSNLPNAYHALRNNFGPFEWGRTLDYVRRGLGEDIEDVATWVDPGGGNIGLSVKFAGRDRQVYASYLSDGMLAYLAFVALFRLSTLSQEPPPLLAFDEADLHLHPHLLMRVLDFCESMGRDFPVLLATHSDRLLDALSDPARSVVLCELDEARATRLYRPDPEALARWLQRYRGIGELRAAGHDASVLTKPEEPA